MIHKLSWLCHDRIALLRKHIDGPLRRLHTAHNKQIHGVDPILHELANYLNHVPNRISLTGHTDITAYSAERGYGNWELSADRANAARRALVDGAEALRPGIAHPQPRAAACGGRDRVAMSHA